MKRFYSFLAMTACMVSAMAQTTTEEIPLTFCIEVEDPSLIFVQDSNYESVELKKGENVFTTIYHKTTSSNGSSYGYSDGMYIYVYSDKSSEYNIYSCDYQVGGEEHPYNSVSYPTTSVYLSLDESMDGCIFHPVVETIESHRTASVTVRVEGDPSDVMIRFASGYSPELSEEVNIVKFDPENESAWTIGPRNYGDYLSEVVLNGAEIQESYGVYYVNVTDGDELFIDSRMQNEDISVRFTFTNEGTENAISEVYRYINYTRHLVTDWMDGLTAKSHSQIIVVLNLEDYRINSLTVNGRSQYLETYNPEVFITLTENSVINIDAELYSTFSVELNLDDPAQVNVYLADSPYAGSYQLTDLMAGKQTLEISDRMEYMLISEAENCYINSITYLPAGASDVIEPDYGYNGYIIPLSEGTKIYVHSYKMVRDSHATLWINNIDYVYTLILGYADGSEIFNTYGEVKPVTGSQTFAFNQERDNPIYLYFSPTNGGVDPEKQGYVQVNGVTVQPYYTGTTSYRLNIVNGDEIRVYANESETTGLEGVTIENGAASSTIYDLFGRQITPGKELHPGIYVIGGKKVLVK